MSLFLCPHKVNFEFLKRLVLRFCLLRVVINVETKLNDLFVKNKLGIEL